MKNKRKQKLEILTLILISTSIFIYEICYCNFITITEKTYNFSLFRITMYAIFLILYKVFSEKFIEEAEKTLNSKKKIISIYIIISILLIIYFFTSNMNIYYIFIGLIAQINGLLFILYITKDYIKNIIITTLTLGFIFSITTTAYHIVDEKKHFMSALNVADGNFDIENSITEETFNNIEFNTYMRTFAMKYFGEKYSKNITEIPEDETVFSTPSGYNPLSYLPSALGINIARLLGGSVADIFIAGRIFNLITFSILLIIIFKLLPFKKDTFYVVYLLPIMTVLAGTYSVDGITLGLVGIFIAYTLKLYKENYETVTMKQFLILLTLFIFSLLCKSGSYFGICMIVFILPIFKIIKQNKQIGILILIMLIIGVSLAIYKGNEIVSSNKGDTRVTESNPAKQMEFLLSNPTNILKVYDGYLNESLLNLKWYSELNIKAFFGKRAYSIAFLIFITIIYTAITDCSYTTNKKLKVITISTFSVTFIITSLVLYLAYTKVGKLTIGGYQARYIIPILPLILINISSKKISKDSINSDNYNKPALYIGLLTFLDLMSRIII